MAPLRLEGSYDDHLADQTTLSSSFVLSAKAVPTSWIYTDFVIREFCFSLPAFVLGYTRNLLEITPNRLTHTQVTIFLLSASPFAHNVLMKVTQTSRHKNSAMRRIVPADRSEDVTEVYH